MVLQVFADAVQLADGRDARGAQPLRVAEAGKLQNLRRLHRSGAKQDFAVRMRLARLTTLRELHARRAALVDQDARGAGPGLESQVRPPPEDRAQIASRSAPALAVADGQLVGAEAL